MLIMFHPNYLDQHLGEAGFVLGHLVVGQLVLPREVAKLFNLINLFFQSRCRLTSCSFLKTNRHQLQCQIVIGNQQDQFLGIHRISFVER